MADILSIGASGLNSYQRALQVTGNNIVNANTDGYVRRNANLVGVGQAQQTPTDAASGTGGGVMVDAVKRAADDFVQSEMRMAQSMSSQASTLSDRLGTLQKSLFSGNNDVGTSIQNFFNSAQDLSTSPTSLAVRTTFLQSANNLTSAFNGQSSVLTQESNSVGLDLKGQVQALNALTSQLAQLNSTIASTAGAQGQLNDLLDQRDKAVDQIVKLVGVTAQTQSNGTVSLTLGAEAGNLQLVGPAGAKELSAQQSDGQTVLTFDPYGKPTPINQINGGVIAGLVDYGNQLSNMMDQLNRIATALSTAVNKQHMQGVDLKGNKAGPLFSTTSLQGTASPANKGSTTVSVNVGNANAIQPGQYIAQFNGQNNAWSITNTTTGLSASAKTAVSLDGMTFTFTGQGADGDTYSFAPLTNVASELHVLLNDPTQLAASLPQMAQRSASNLGSATMELGATGQPIPAPSWPSLATIFSQSQTPSNALGIKADGPVASIPSGASNVTLTSLKGISAATFNFDPNKLISFESSNVSAQIVSSTATIGLGSLKFNDGDAVTLSLPSQSGTNQNISAIYSSDPQTFLNNINQAIQLINGSAGKTSLYPSASLASGNLVFNFSGQITTGAVNIGRSYTTNSLQLTFSLKGQIPPQKSITLFGDNSQARLSTANPVSSLVTEINRQLAMNKLDGKLFASQVNGQLTINALGNNELNDYVALSSVSDPSNPNFVSAPKLIATGQVEHPTQAADINLFTQDGHQLSGSPTSAADLTAANGFSVSGPPQTDISADITTRSASIAIPPALAAGDPLTLTVPTDSGFPLHVALSVPPAASQTLPSLISPDPTQATTPSSPQAMSNSLAGLVDAINTALKAAAAASTPSLSDGTYPVATLDGGSIKFDYGVKSTAKGQVVLGRPYRPDLSVQSSHSLMTTMGDNVTTALVSLTAQPASNSAYQNADGTSNAGAVYAFDIKGMPPIRLAGDAIAGKDASAITAAAVNAIKAQMPTQTLVGAPFALMPNDNFPSGSFQLTINGTATTVNFQRDFDSQGNALPSGKFTPSNNSAISVQLATVPNAASGITYTTSLTTTPLGSLALPSSLAAGDTLTIQVPTTDKKTVSITAQVPASGSLSDFATSIQTALSQSGADVATLPTVTSSGSNLVFSDSRASLGFPSPLTGGDTYAVSVPMIDGKNISVAVQVPLSGSFSDFANAVQTALVKSGVNPKALPTVTSSGSKLVFSNYFAPVAGQITATSLPGPTTTLTQSQDASLIIPATNLVTGTLLAVSLPTGDGRNLLATVQVPQPPTLGELSQKINASIQDAGAALIPPATSLPTVGVDPGGPSLSFHFNSAVSGSLAITPAQQEAIITLPPGMANLQPAPSLSISGSDAAKFGLAGTLGQQITASQPLGTTAVISSLTSGAMTQNLSFANFDPNKSYCLSIPTVSGNPTTLTIQKNSADLATMMGEINTALSAISGAPTASLGSDGTSIDLLYNGRAQGLAQQFAPTSLSVTLNGRDQTVTIDNFQGSANGISWTTVDGKLSFTVPASASPNNATIRPLSFATTTADARNAASSLGFTGTDLTVQQQLTGSTPPTPPQFSPPVRLGVSANGQSFTISVNASSGSDATSGLSWQTDNAGRFVISSGFATPPLAITTQTPDTAAGARALGLVDAANAPTYDASTLSVSSSVTDDTVGSLVDTSASVSRVAQQVTLKGTAPEDLLVLIHRNGSPPSTGQIVASYPQTMTRTNPVLPDMAIRVVRKADDTGPGQVEIVQIDKTGNPVAVLGRRDYQPNQPLSYLGASFTIKGDAEVNDSFTITTDASRTGDNRNSLKIADLINQNAFDVGSGTFLDVYNEEVSKIGSNANVAQATATSTKAAADELAAQYSTTTGVSLDTEAANLLKLQQAYQACAQIMTTARDMFDTILKAF